MGKSQPTEGLWGPMGTRYSSRKHLASEQQLWRSAPCPAHPLLPLSLPPYHHNTFSADPIPSISISLPVSVQGIRLTEATSLLMIPSMRWK